VSNFFPSSGRVKRRFVFGRSFERQK
jgi:hypothetical protein